MLDILGSYFIGALVLLTMMAVVLTLQEKTQDTVFNEISQVTMADMTQTLDKEMTNIGYRVTGPQKILALDYRSITFLSDYDNNGVVDTLRYRMEAGADGPNIVRTISAVGSTRRSWRSSGSLLLLTGYDANGNVTTNAADIAAVETTVLTSNVMYSELRDGSFSLANTSQTALIKQAVDKNSGAYHHKIYYPKNLAIVPPLLADATPAGTTGVTTDTSGTTGETIVPPANKTDPCPCGSGEKYFKCHGV